MGTAIITVVLTFALSTFFGNWLLQRWQQRSWLHQQALLGEQKHYENLKDLCDQILEHSNARISKMRRLLSALQEDDIELIKVRLSDYDKAIIEWNEKIGIFLVKLRFYAHYNMAFRLDESVQSAFARLGSSLERLTRSRLVGAAVSNGDIGRLQIQFNDLNGRIISYNRDLMNVLAIQKTRTYYGKQIELRPDTLKHFPTWELVKALFKPRIEPPRIVRSPTELSPPFGSRK
jgi:hypothetical protein